jgi:hypothetical protein
MSYGECPQPRHFSKHQFNQNIPPSAQLARGNVVIEWLGPRLEM